MQRIESSEIKQATSQQYRKQASPLTRPLVVSSQETVYGLGKKTVAAALFDASARFSPEAAHA
jgi:hypothetical protein